MYDIYQYAVYSSSLELSIMRAMRGWHYGWFVGAQDFEPLQTIHNALTVASALA